MSRATLLACVTSCFLDAHSRTSEADVRDAQSAILRAAERVEAARREVRLAEELEEAERTRYAQGDSQLLIVNLREQQTAEAELRAIDARLDHQRAIADLRAARGE